MRTVGIVYGGLIDIGCFSHTLDHVGERVNTPNLDAFFKAWVSHSPKAVEDTNGHHPLGGGVSLKCFNNCTMLLDLSQQWRIAQGYSN